MDYRAQLVDYADSGWITRARYPLDLLVKHGLWLMATFTTSDVVKVAINRA